MAISPVAAQTAVVRLGMHEGFGRVVFEFPQTQAFTTVREDNVVVLHFPGAGDIPDAPGVTRNVAAVTGGGAMATITIAPKARLRMVRMDNRVVVDVMDPPKPSVARNGPSKAAGKPVPGSATAATASTIATPVTEAPAPASRPPASPVTSATPAPAQPVAPLSLPQVAPSPSPPEAPPPRSASAAAPAGPLAVSVTRLDPPPGIRGAAAMLPFDPSTGAAAFRHGAEAWVVFDERRPLDAGSLANDPEFANLSVELLPGATLLRLQSTSARSIRLERRQEGWSLVSSESPGGPTVMPTVKASRLLFPLATPGQVVAVPDADTGRNLLVGTLKAAGPGVPVGSRTPEFAVLPSWQGVVIEPISDRSSLRVVPEGYAVETGGALSPKPEGGPVLAGAAALTRRFDFPNEPVAALLRRLQSQVQEEGEAPPQARLAPRKAAAQTMLALGLGAEAQALLRLAVSEDPRATADPDVGGLSGVAALISARPQEAGGLDSPGLSGSDEITLWRGVRDAMANETSAAAAQAFAATGALVAAYPPALRTRLLPLVVETMVAGGAPRAADGVLASLPDEPLLAMARGLRLEQKGDTASALTVYDALASGRDRLSSARAAVRGTMLRLNSGTIGPADAADLLERSLGDWRGDTRERDLRLQVSAVEAKAGRWRAAFTLLKETAQLFPDDAPAIAARMTSLLGDLLHEPATASIPPLDLVALAEENADAIAKTDAAGMASLLADKLVALDLPQRAAPVIERLALASPPGAARARLGSRLATLWLASGDPDGASAALAETDAANLPPPLQEERDLVDARIHAQRGDVPGAAAILSRIDSVAAGDLRAKLLADSGDWHGAAIALAEVVARTLPETGPLGPEQQDLLLRLASAQSRAGDEEALHRLGAKQAARLSGARADMFKLLTAEPVTRIADIGRVSGDIALARALPAALSAIGTR